MAGATTSTFEYASVSNVALYGFTPVYTGASIFGSARTISVSSATPSSILQFDASVSPFSVGFGVLVSGSITYSIWYSFDGVSWIIDDEFAGLTSSVDGHFAFPVLYVKLVHDYGGGTATGTFIQSGSIWSSVRTGANTGWTQISTSGGGF